MNQTSWHGRAIHALAGPKVTRRDWATSLVFLAPAVLILVVTTLYPIANSLWISLFSWNPMDPARTVDFVGIDNYVRIIQDPGVQSAIARTFVFVGASVGLELVLGLGIAVVLTSPIRLVGLVRTTIFVPLVMTPVVIGILWGQMLNFQYGIVNFGLELAGLPHQNLLGRPDQALMGVVLVEVWQFTPVVALILAAGLLSLPHEVLEAARVDGASALQSFRYVTLPLLRPVIVVALLLRITDAFKVFDVIYVLTQGGPAGATKVVSMLIYETGLKFFEVGRASAISWIFLVIVGSISLLFVRRLAAGASR